MKVRLGLILLAWLAAAAPVAADGIDPAVRAAYEEVSIAVPTAHAVVVCHGFGCKYRTPITLTDGDRRVLRQLLAAGRRSPAAERQAVAAAVAWFGRRIAPATGTGRAVARAGFRYAGDRSQFDCIDASRNTTSVLVVLDLMGLLRHHQVEAPAARGFFFDGVVPHATAVLVERASGRKWAIDSWTRDSGEEPEVMPLKQWLSEG